MFFCCSEYDHDRLSLSTPIAASAGPDCGLSGLQEKETSWEVWRPCPFSKCVHRVTVHYNNRWTEKVFQFADVWYSNVCVAVISNNYTIDGEEEPHYISFKQNDTTKKVDQGQCMERVVCEEDHDHEWKRKWKGSQLFIFSWSRSETWAVQKQNKYHSTIILLIIQSLSAQICSLCCLEKDFLVYK